MNSSAWIVILGICFTPILPMRADEPQLETLRLVGGRELQGFIAADAAGSITFKRIYPVIGSRMLVLSNSFAANEVEQLNKLPTEPRQRLAARVKAAEELEQKLRARRQALTFTVSPVPGSQSSGLRFQGVGFSIVSDVDPEVLRIHIPPLEDFLAATARRLPARPDAPELRFVLYRRLADYQAWQRSHAVRSLDPVFHVPGTAEIGAYLESDRLAGELRKVRDGHARKHQELEEYLGKLQRHFGGQPPQGGILRVRDIRIQLEDFDAENQAALERRATETDQLLNQESLQAWLEQVFLDPTSAAAPRWLAEGLAQYASVQPLAPWSPATPDQWGNLRAESQAGRLWTLRKLLTADPRGFNVNNHRQGRLRDSGHLSAFAAAYFLVSAGFLERSESFRSYCEKLSAGAEPIAAFEQWTGRPLADFESRFTEWLDRPINPQP